MNKTIKKIVALSMGATMLAGTAAMALAADLSDYPSPFIKDSVFVGKIVIGETADAIDVLGATDIAASLQRKAAVGVAGSTSSSATATDGYHFEENDVLIYGATLPSVGKNTVDDADLPELLASGIVENDDTEFEYDVELDFSGSLGTVDGDIDGDLEDLGYSEPMVYFSLDEGEAYDVVIDFQDAWDASDFQNSETIELFGVEYTFDPDNTNTDDVLTLYGSETTLLIAKGGSETVTYNGKEYTLEVLGGNSDDSTAILRINGDTRTVSEGDSKTMPSGGLPIYVKNVFVSNIGGDDVSVQLFIGSNKLELDEDGTVTKNGVELDEVALAITGGNATHPWYNVDTLRFTVSPGSADEEVKFILPGEAYVDPLFGAFKLEFVGSKDLAAGKEEVAFTRSGDTVTLEFLPRDASSPVEVLLLDGATPVPDADLWSGATLQNLQEDDTFFYNDGTAADNYITHVLQIDSISEGNVTSDEDFEVVIKDLSHGKTYTIDDTTSAVSSDITLYAIQGSTGEGYISFAITAGGANATTERVLYTNAGARLTAATTAFANWTIAEDMDTDAETSTPVTDIAITTSWIVADSEYDLATDGGSANDLDDDNDDVDYYLSDFGTYVEVDTDEDTYVKLYVPDKEVSYDMFLTPLDAEIVVTSSSSGGAVALNPISVGMAILDSEASLGNKAYIVVGGPCANTVAAELMGSPADCAAGFTEGKAMIKLYSAKNALLVAGYAGKDTQGACRVLANYEDYGFAGTELEVTTANLNSLSVKKLS